MKKLILPLSALIVGQFYFNQKVGCFIPKVAIKVWTGKYITKIVKGNGNCYKVHYSNLTIFEINKNESMMVLV